MEKIITLVSGKGGTGKTFISCNSGVLLGLSQFKTLIVDADVNLANVELVYNIKAKFTLQDFIEGTCDVSDVLYNAGAVTVVPAGVQLKRRIRPSEFDNAIAKIISETDFDYVLIDAPAGLDAQVVTCIKMCDEYILITNPEITSLVDAYKVKKVAGEEKFLGIVLNKFKKTSITKKNIEESLGEIIAAIPEDPKIPQTINSGVPYVMRYPDSLTTKQLAKLVSKITGRDVVLSPKKKFEFSLDGIKGIIGKKKSSIDME